MPLRPFSKARCSNKQYEALVSFLNSLHSIFGLWSPARAPQVVLESCFTQTGFEECFSFCLFFFLFKTEKMNFCLAKLRKAGISSKGWNLPFQSSLKPQEWSHTTLHELWSGLCLYVNLNGHTTCCGQNKIHSGKNKCTERI